MDKGRAMPTSLFVHGLIGPDMIFPRTADLAGYVAGHFM